MAHFIGMARAARMLGVDRHTLQQLVHDGQLETFEGQVDVEALRERYPGMLTDEPGILEHVRTLRQTAFARRVQEAVAPNPEALSAQLHKLDVELSIERHHAKKYRQIVEDLVRKLNELHPTVTVEQRMLISDICCWLAGRIEDR